MKNLLIIAAIFAVSTLHAQSILTTPPETPAQQAARETVQAIQAARTAQIGILRDGVSRLWDSPDPAGALIVLGPNAAEVVAIYQSLVTYLTTVLTAAGDTDGLAQVAAISAKVPPLTVHQDGTVTINPPDPEPEE